MRVGRMNRFVTLSKQTTTTNDSDGLFEALDPSSWWVAIDPMDPSSMGDGTRIMASRVTMRYHPQVTVDTRIVYADPNLLRDRELFVKGVQNVADDNNQMVLYCEEVLP